MRRYTEVGRVVYTRKPHLFTLKDLARISENVVLPHDFNDYAYAMEILVNAIFKILQTALDFFPWLWVQRQALGFLYNLLWRTTGLLTSLGEVLEVKQGPSGDPH